jgi:hypothetical protein
LTPPAATLTRVAVMRLTSPIRNSLIPLTIGARTDLGIALANLRSRE